MNNPTLSQTSRPFTSPEQEAHDQVALQGALSALSALSVTWLRRAGASPSQTHWEDCERVQLDDGGDL
jgi:hypothetical protein